MNFLRPEFLYLLLIIPILIALNLFFKGKRTIPVTTLFIWERFHEVHKPKNITFNRLKKDIPLLLQILFVLLSTITLSQPTFFKIEGATERVVFIFDSSISMGAGIEGNQHIDLAKNRAIQLLQDKYKSNQVMIIKAASDPEIVHKYSLDTKQLVDAVRSISITDTITDLSRTITMAFSLREAPSRIIVFTCGLPGDTGLASSKQNIIEWVSVGDTLDNNIVISKFDIRQDFSVNRNYQAFLRITNDSDLKQNFKIKVFHDEVLYEERDIIMTPHESKELLMPLDQIRDGLISIKIDVNDDLVADNEVFALLEPERRLSVLTVTSGNSFLESVLALHDSVDIILCNSSNYEEKINTGNYDVVIYDNVSNPFNTFTDSIIICSKENEFTDTTKGIVSPGLLNINYGHTKLKGLDLSNLSINKSYTLNVPEWGDTLIESEHGALMFSGERDNKKLLVTGYDLLQSNFPIEIAFPLFIARVVDWFKGNEQGSWITAGEAYHYKIPGTTIEDSVTVTMPNGEQYVNSIKNNLVTITDTMKAGVYRIEGDTFRKKFVVNFQTGNIADKNAFSKNINSRMVSSALETTPMRLVFLFATLSLGVLVAEWYFYVRT